MEDIELLELTSLEAYGFVTIYCMLPPRLAPQTIFNIPKYHNNFKNLLKKYPKIPPNNIFDFIKCEYKSEIKTTTHDEDGNESTHWISLYAKNRIDIKTEE